jgi:Trk K+ transport system NAD-binding subunit
LVALATLYSLLVAPWLLKKKNRADPDEEEGRVDLAAVYGVDDDLWELFVKPGCEADGEPLKEVGMGRDFGLNPILVLRQGEAVPVEGEDFVLRENDVVAVTGKEAKIREFEERQPEMVVMGRPDSRKEFSWSAFELVEVVTPPRSDAVGRTLRDLRMRNETDLTCIGLWRGDRPYRTGTRDLKLAAGDGLLLFGAREKVRGFRPAPPRSFPGSSSTPRGPTAISGHWWPWR